MLAVCARRPSYDRLPTGMPAVVFYSVTSKPQLKSRGCENVLPGEGYLTPQGSVIDECGAMVE
jgi:hypothetical protein